MIEVDRLTKEFEVPDGVKRAVDGISFGVERGEVFGLLGANGAGKTTTLRMVLGLMEPTRGTARINGYDIRYDPGEVKRSIGYASASVGVYPWLSPREMLMFAADLYDVPNALARKRVDELAELLNLVGFLNQRSATLSTGQKQRVNLARALVHDPPVMLMDEPTRGLDIVGSKVVFDYIDHLRSRNKAVIVCTHRLAEAERICDQFGLLHHGVMRRMGDLESLRRETGQPTLTDMFIELLGENESAVAAALAEQESLAGRADGGTMGGEK